MPTPFTPLEHRRLTQILEGLRECGTPDDQRQFVGRAFRFLKRGADLAAQLGSKATPHQFVVGLIDDLDTRHTQLDGQKTLAVLMAYVADDILIEGDAADFLRGLLDKYFSGAAVLPVERVELVERVDPIVIGPVPANDPAPALIAELTHIRELLAQMREDDRASTNEIMAALSQRMIADAEADELATALRTLALRALGEVQASQTQLREQLSQLAIEHQAGATGYLSASIPLIPGILQYNIELGTQHTLDLKAFLTRIRQKIGMKGKPAHPLNKPREKVRVPGQMRGIFVGVNQYQDDGISPLSMPAKDAMMLSKMLAPTYRTLALLTDDTPKTAPTRENILAQLAAMASAAEEDDLILFYFSGHGMDAEGESYLLPSNARHNILRDTAVPVARVCEILNSAACKARAKVIILDACHSGAKIGRKGEERMTAAFIERVFSQAEGIAVISSCRQDEVSWEASGLGHGVFTYYLLAALSGQADFDGKGFVSVNDAFRFVSNGVKAWAESRLRTQRPTINLEADGDMILMRYA